MSNEKRLEEIRQKQAAYAKLMGNGWEPHQLSSMGWLCLIDVPWLLSELEKAQTNQPSSGPAVSMETLIENSPAPSVEVPRLVRLEYEGKPWTAERLKTSSYVHFKNAENPNDGMMWAVPDQNMGNLAWRIYHTNYTPTREELFGMLKVIDSYRSLLAKPAKRQRTLARALLQFILPNA